MPAPKDPPLSTASLSTPADRPRPVGALLMAALRYDEPRVLAHQLALIQRYLPIAMPASALVAIFVAGIHHYLAGDRAVWLWAGLTVLISLAGLLLSRRQSGPLPEGTVARQGRRVRLLAVALGAAWGALAWGFMLTPVLHTTNLVLGALAGLNSGGMVLFSPALPLSVLYLCGTIPVAAVLLLLSPLPQDQVMGLAVGTYWVAMMGFCQQSARAVRESIELRFANMSLVARLRDQTERAFDARQTAEEALQEAEAANRAKAVFLAAASHDLRQPLHALGLFTSTLAATPLSPRQRALLAQADGAAEAARDMLGTLLDFSKVDAGVITPRAQAFALGSLLERLGQEFGPQAEALGLSYRTRPTSAVVLADPTLVERILRNLLGNALRYTERGGVLVGCRRRGTGCVSVEVWDTGLGIPAHQHQAVFQEFHQLGNPERDRRKGLGLGLAIVDGLARAMSTSVTLASVPGRGSVFRLTLALTRQAVLPEAAPPPEVDLAGARVLVIDDDETVRAAMAELITSWGAWVEVVESAQEAVALLRRFTPQVVMADYRLRGQDTGRDALEAVRAAAGQRLPGVLVTGDTAADRLRDARAADAVLLHKPVPAAQLQAVLSRLLASPQAPVMEEAAATAAPPPGPPGPVPAGLAARPAG